MRRKLLLASLATLVIAVAAASCGPAGFDVDLAEATVAPSPSPTGFDGIPPFGTGSDLELVISNGETEKINVCHVLETVAQGGTALTMVTDDFEAGDVLLLLQDRDLDTAGPPGTAGTFELVRIDKKNGGAVFTVHPIVHPYLTSGIARAQACSVPEFTELQVLSGGTLRATPRTAVTGGVLAFLVSSSFTLEAGGIVTAEDGGFAGGDCDANTAIAVSDDLDDPQGGGTGEGFLDSGQGRGNLANGGGGGNPLRAGGGGGGAAGAGGRGGGAAQVGATTDNEHGFGFGGDAMAMLGSGRLYFGGGGGGGHSSGTDTAPCDGGAGGGVIFAQVREGHGSGRARAPGASVTGAPSFTSGGGGGGGAGGTIWLIVGSGGDFTPGIDVTGGSGGNVVDTPGAAGPGGGGGGGFARIGVALQYELGLAGGSAGVIEGTSDRRGAATGQVGREF